MSRILSEADICGALYDVRFQELSGTRVSYVRQMATLSALIKKRTETVFPNCAQS